MDAKLRWTLALALVAVFWGWSFVAIHQATQTIAANQFNFLRFLIATLVLLPFAGRQLSLLTRSQWAGSVGAGTLLFLAFAFQTEGIARTNPSNAGFITGMAVLFVPLFTYLFIRSRLNTNQLVGIVFAFIGLGLLTLQELQLHIGDMLVLACAVFAALHIVVLSVVSQRVDSLALATVQVAVVTLLSGLAAWGEGSLAAPSCTDGLWTLLLLGVFGTALGYVVQTRAQEVVPPSSVALVVLLEPVAGGIFGYTLADDPFTYMKLLGALLVVLGVVIGESKFNRRVAI